MKLSAVLMVVLSLVYSPLKEECRCRKAAEDEHTNRSWQSIVLTREWSVTALKGRVLDLNDKPMAEALVEIFEDPAVSHTPYSAEVERRRERQRRVAACKTAEDGRYCFQALGPGRYELRCSKFGFDTTSLTVRVGAHRRGKAHSQIDVTMQVSN